MSASTHHHQRSQGAEIGYVDQQPGQVEVVLEQRTAARLALGELRAPGFAQVVGDQVTDRVDAATDEGRRLHLKHAKQLKIVIVSFHFAVADLVTMIRGRRCRGPRGRLRRRLGTVSGP